MVEDARLLVLLDEERHAVRSPSTAGVDQVEAGRLDVEAESGLQDQPGQGSPVLVSATLCFGALSICPNLGNDSVGVTQHPRACERNAIAWGEEDGVDVWGLRLRRTVGADLHEERVGFASELDAVSGILENLFGVTYIVQYRILIHKLRCISRRYKRKETTEQWRYLRQDLR